MNPWELLDEEAVANSRAILRLYRRGDEYSIRVDQVELMNSRMHASEEALAHLACGTLGTGGSRTEGARILVGGLGMGFTLAAVLHDAPADAQITVAELMPAVVRWNRTSLAHLAGEPLSDPRVRVEIADVRELMGAASESYDAIILDVDNGPSALTHPANAGLYSLAGLTSAQRALRRSGVLAVWSAAASPEFAERLRAAGFEVQEARVRAREGRGAHHWLWVAARGVRPKKSTL